MYEDAIKTSGHEGEIELRELTELVLESLELDGDLVSARAREPTMRPRDPGRLSRSGTRHIGARSLCRLEAEPVTRPGEEIE